MKIIILGAGQVGSTLAETLCHEKNDITLIDTDVNRTRDMQSRMDIRTIVGPGSHPSLLREAGIENADMLIAVTNNDETNMVACEIAYTLFKTPTKIARIRSQEYLDLPELFSNKAIPVDLCISPELLVTNSITRLIEYPSALQVLDFADGQVQMVAARPYYGGQLVGKSLSEFPKILDKIDMGIVAIYRHGRSVPLSPNAVIEVGDEVFFVGDHRNIKSILHLLRRKDEPYERIVIAGGGNIGYRLASELEKNYQIKIIDPDKKRCQWLSERLTHTLVIEGDACDRKILWDENIDHTDVFCALTSDDEANIISSMQAKRLGVRKVLALVRKTAYVDLIEGGVIDIAISPQQVTIGRILTYLRRGDIVNVHSLRRGAAEAIEIVAHGDERTSKVIGHTLEEIDFPEGTGVGAIVRCGETIIPNEKTKIEAGDHLILFIVHQKNVHKIEKLFQVGFQFF